MVKVTLAVAMFPALSDARASKVVVPVKSRVNGMLASTHALAFPNESL